MELRQYSSAISEELIGKTNSITLLEMLVICSKIRDLDEISKNRLDDITDSFYYSRSVCNALDLDYNNLNSKDMSKVKTMVYLSMFRDDINN